MENKKKILVADDDRAVTEVMKSGLEGQGYDVVVTHDGNEALELAKLYKPDLAILDVLMPGMDGVRVASYLKLDTETRDIPIMILTGFVEKENEQQMQQELRGALFMTKPFNLKDFLRMVAQALAEKEEKKS
ncbi:MAG: response regulator [Elusimicrobiota bacterium]